MAVLVILVIPILVLLDESTPADRRLPILKSRLSGQQGKFRDMLQTSPFILFDGNCAEAMSFYRECLGGELSLTKLSDTPMKEQFPAEKQNRIIYGQLKNDKIDLSAADWMASPALEPKHGNTFSIYLTGEAYDELKPVFDKLALGADKDKRTFMELDSTPFGVYGQFTDKYGVAWIFKGAKQR